MKFYPERKTVANEWVGLSTVTDLESERESIVVVACHARIFSALGSHGFIHNLQHCACSFTAVLPSNCALARVARAALPRPTSYTTMSLYTSGDKEHIYIYIYIYI